MSTVAQGVGAHSVSVLRGGDGVELHPRLAEQRLEHISTNSAQGVVIGGSYKGQRWACPQKSLLPRWTSVLLWCGFGVPVRRDVRTEFLEVEGARLKAVE